MRFAEPNSIEEAISLLAADPDARCLAGGATLVAMMNAGLTAPSLLVSLNKLRGLDEIAPQGDGSVRVGAMARHATVAAYPGFADGQAIVSAAARRIGHPAIRNMGTIGGSISHADSAADYPTALVAADAVVEISGPEGARAIPADEFFVDWLETALEPGEIVTGVLVPEDRAACAVHYEKFTRADGDFATVSTAACIALSDSGTVTAIRVAAGGVAPTPIRSRDAEQELTGRPLSDDGLTALGMALVELSDPVDDMRGSAEYRRRLLPRIVSRAVRRAATVFAMRSGTQSREGGVE